MKEVDEEDNNDNYTTNYAYNINNINEIENNTSVKKVSMKCNKEFLTFDKKTYPIALHDYIQKWEWETIAEEGNLVIGNAFHLRKLEENVQIPKYMNVIFWFLFFFFLNYFHLFNNIYQKRKFN